MRFGRLQRRETGVAVTRAILLALFVTTLFSHAQFLLSFVSPAGARVPPVGGAPPLYRAAPHPAPA